MSNVFLNRFPSDPTPTAAQLSAMSAADRHNEGRHQAQAALEACVTRLRSIEMQYDIDLSDVIDGVTDCDGDVPAEVTHWDMSDD